MRRFLGDFWGVSVRLAAVALAVCGLVASTGARADDKAAEPGTAKAGAAAKVPGPPEVPWKDLNAEQRARYMKAVVTPKMRVAFQAFDGETFKKFNCSTCHGKDAKARKYKMPSPDVHPLPGTPAAFQAAMKEKPTWPKFTKFMSEQVMPDMATLLGLPVFDHKKPDPGAFGCQGCHTIQKS